MKLKNWADKQGISYLTAYRWFKDDKLPVKAIQTESGTILVEENIMENNEIMTLFINKTVEFSKNNASIEDFASYILSNFSLKAKDAEETSKPAVPSISDFAGMQDLVKSLSSILQPQPISTQSPKQSFSNNTGYYDGNSITAQPHSISAIPQSINYLSYPNNVVGATGVLDTVNCLSINSAPSSFNTSTVMANGIQPTSQAIEKAHSALAKMADEIRATAVKSKRGRKSHKGNT